MKADRIIFVCTLLLAGVYFYAIEQIPTLQVGDPMGAKAIPRFLGCALLITAVLLFLEMKAAKKEQDSDKSKQMKQDEDQENKGQFVVVSAVVIWTGLYFAVFELLGYAIATAIYLVVLMAYFNKGKWVANVLTSVLFSFGSYLAFAKLFDTPLAPGLLPF